MKKNYILAIVLITSAFLPQNVFAAEYCSCHLKITGKGDNSCNVTTSEGYPNFFVEKNAAISVRTMFDQAMSAGLLDLGKCEPVNSAQIIDQAAERASVARQDANPECTYDQSTPNFRDGFINVIENGDERWYAYDFTNCSISAEEPTLGAPAADFTLSSSNTIPTNINVPPVTSLTNPIAGTKDNPKGITDVNILIGTIVNTVVGITGSFALLAFIAGGFLWLTSAGNPEKIKMGSNAMIWAAVGMFIILTSYAIISTLLQGITR